MMTKGGSTKIVNFMTPGAGVLVLGHDHISNIVKMLNFIKQAGGQGGGVKIMYNLVDVYKNNAHYCHCFNGS